MALLALIAGIAALGTAFSIGGSADEPAEPAVVDTAGGQTQPPNKEPGFLEKLTNVAKQAQGGGTAQPPAARLVNGKPEGLFFMTRFWSYTGTLEKAAWYFAPDGRVYRDLETGFSAADLAAHKGAQGTYQVNGTKMTVTWQDGKTSASNIEPDEPAFTWDMGIFTPAKSFAGPGMVSGEWEGGESLSVGGNTAAVSKTLRLNPDGSFTWDAVSFVKGETNESVVSGGSQGTTTGRWNLDGYSLILTDSGGNVLRGIAFPYDDEETPIKPDRFFFAGTMYKKRG